MYPQEWATERRIGPGRSGSQTRQWASTLANVRGHAVGSCGSLAAVLPSWSPQDSWLVPLYAGRSARARRGRFAIARARLPPGRGPTVHRGLLPATSGLACPVSEARERYGAQYLAACNRVMVCGSYRPHVAGRDLGRRTPFDDRKNWVLAEPSNSTSPAFESLPACVTPAADSPPAPCDAILRAQKCARRNLRIASPLTHSQMPGTA